jgi:acyl dehydratase
MRARRISAAELRERVGQEIGVSDWIAVNQPMIDQFADATMDHQFIHVDPERARAVH